MSEGFIFVWIFMFQNIFGVWAVLQVSKFSEFPNKTILVPPDIGHKIIDKGWKKEWHNHLCKHLIDLHHKPLGSVSGITQCASFCAGEGAECLSFETNVM